MARKTTVQRIIARVRALLDQDWFGRAGERFRETTKAISDFAEDHGVKPEDLVVDGVRKLRGLANKEFAAALQAFAETEQKKIDTELKRRTIESAVVKEKAEARLTQLKALDAEVELLKKLKEMHLVILQDARGNLTVVPAPIDCDPTKLIHRRPKIVDTDDQDT